MITNILASEQENVLLKKGYVVFCRFALLKGFEINRCEELELLKVFEVEFLFLLDSKN